MNIPIEKYYQAAKILPQLNMGKMILKILACLPELEGTSCGVGGIWFAAVSDFSNFKLYL